MTGRIVLDGLADREPNYWITDMALNGTFVRIADVLNSDLGMTGRIVLDGLADREPNYWITDMALNGTFVRVAEVINIDLGKMIFRKSILPPRWPKGKIGHQYAPPDTPVCGFRNEFCESEEVAGWIITVAAVLAVLAIGAASGLATYLFRRSKYETQLLVQSWRILWEDIETLKGNPASMSTMTAGKSSGNVGSVTTMSSTSRSVISQNVDIIKSKIASSNTNDQSKSSLSKSMPSVGTGGGQIFSDIGLYRGTVVSIKHVHKQHLTLSRNVLLEFNEIKDVVHENLNVFVGACVDPPNISLLWHYCPKGSLT
ncbi:hypothetical protein CAPTEDRAFT_202807, partial [Capitella teleta]